MQLVYFIVPVSNLFWDFKEFKWEGLTHLILIAIGMFVLQPTQGGTFYTLSATREIFEMIRRKNKRCTITLLEEGFAILLAPYLVTSGSYILYLFAPGFSWANGTVHENHSLSSITISDVLRHLVEW